MKTFNLNLLKPVFFSLCIAFLSACSSNADASLSTKAAKAQQMQQQRSSTLAKLEQKSTTTTHKILAAYSQWAGTRYRMGGTTHRGIDCSAFVQKAMGKALGITLPRSTAEQRHSGHKISKSELRPGDLVFFRRNNHVGIYIGNGKFVHASSSQGVTTSSLSESYWSRTYTQSRRVL